jgi:hypothetical protein
MNCNQRAGVAAGNVDRQVNEDAFLFGKAATWNAMVEIQPSGEWAGS